MSLSKALKKLAAERGWNQGDVAKRSTLDRTYVNRLFRGKIRDIGVRTAILLARSFGITVEDLWQMMKDEGDDGDCPVRIDN